METRNIAEQIDFPELILLGTSDRPGGSTDVKPLDVAKPDDLPRRLLVGSLVHESISITADEWHAEWRDDELDASVSLTCLRSSRLVLFDTAWRGIRGYSGSTTCRGWMDAVKAIFGWPLELDLPADWLDLWHVRLGSRFNVLVSDEVPEGYAAAYFPDGILFDITVPLPIARLRDALSCQQAINADPTIAAVVHSRVELGHTVVNYIDKLCPDFADSSEGAYDQTFAEMGLPPSEAPLREAPAGKPAALTVRRNHYNLIVGCAFRDTERVLQQLNAHGIVGSAYTSQGMDERSSALEYKALVTRGGVVELADHVQYFDTDRTRRITWAKISDISSLDAVSLADCSTVFGEAGELITNAETYAAELWSEYQEEVGRKAVRRVS